MAVHPTAQATSIRIAVSVWVNRLSYVPKWLILGLLIGIVAGLGAVVFINALELATRFFLGVVGGYLPPSPAGEGASLGTGHYTRAWMIPLVTTVGGLLAGLLIYGLAPEAEGHGTDAAIAAVHHNPRGIRTRVSLVKIVASAITIGSGGSGGREGPTGQISAGFASVLSRFFNLSPQDARIAVSIGIGSGIGSIFRTPLGGAVLGAEILYRRDFETEALVPGLIASITGFTVYGAFQGFSPIFGNQAVYGFDKPIQLVYYAAIGLIAGGYGLLYNRSFYGLGGLVKRAKVPRALHPAIGGLLVGLLALVFPQVLGTGYGWVQEAMGPQLLTISLWIVILLPLAKILATSLSIGSGGSGGIFGPGMVIGAFIGASVWRVLEHFAPGVPPVAAPFVIVAMMACFGSIGHVPFAVMLMVAEMTGNLSLLAPAMIAVGLAVLVVGDHHIYRSQLRTRSDSPAHRFRFGLTPLTATAVRNAMRRPVLTVREDEPAREALEKMRAANLQGAPVVDGRGSYAGVARRAGLEEAAQQDETVARATDDSAPAVASDISLDAAMEVLALREVTWLPVLGRQHAVVGIITSRDLVAGYRRALESQLRRLNLVGERVVTVEESVGVASQLVGKRVGQVQWPAGTLVLTVQQGDALLFAHGSTRITEGEILSILTHPETADLVEALVRGDQRGPGEGKEAGQRGKTASGDGGPHADGVDGSEGGDDSGSEEAGRGEEARKGDRGEMVAGDATGPAAERPTDSPAPADDAEQHREAAE
jgi:CIC family chloride channel protein